MRNTFKMLFQVLLYSLAMKTVKLEGIIKDNVDMDRISNISYSKPLQTSAKWILSEAQVEMTVLKLPEGPGSEIISEPTIVLTESFLLHRDPPVQTTTTVSMLKTVVEVSSAGTSPNISVYTSTGEVKSEMKDGNKIKITITTSTFPVQIWVKYLLYDTWEKISFLNDVNPFPLYVNSHDEFGSFWSLKKLFDLGLPDISKNGNVEVDVDRVLFKTTVSDSRIRVTADIFQVMSSSLSSVARGQNCGSCPSHFRGPLHIASCPLTTHRLQSQGNVAQIGLFYSFRFTETLPDKCVRSFTMYSGYTTENMDAMQYLGHLVYTAQPWLTYSVMMAIAIFMCIHAINSLTNKTHFEDLNNYIKTLFAPFVALGMIVGMDSGFRVNMEACYLFYNEDTPNQGLWFLNSTVWLVYPVFSVYIMLIPFQIFSCFAIACLKQLRSYKTMADKVNKATCLSDVVDDEPLKMKSCVVLEIEGQSVDPTAEKPKLTSISNNTVAKPEIPDSTQHKGWSVSHAEDIDWLAGCFLWCMMYVDDLAALYGVTVIAGTVASGLAPVSCLVFAIVTIGLYRLYVNMVDIDLYRFRRNTQNSS